MEGHSFPFKRSLLWQRDTRLQGHKSVLSAGAGVLTAARRGAGASSWGWSPAPHKPPPGPQPTSLKQPLSQEWHCKAEALLTFSSCMVNSLPCSLALFIMKSRASLWSSGLFLCSFSCIAFSINLCSMSRALIPCERHTQFRRTLGTVPLSRETRGTQV